MDWKNALQADPTAWLLDADTPGVPYRTLRELIGPSPKYL